MGKFLADLKDTADGESVVLAVDVARVDVRSIEVQIASVLSRVRGTRPVAAVGAEKVGAAGAVVAAEKETRDFTVSIIVCSSRIIYCH